MPKPDLLATHAHLRISDRLAANAIFLCLMLMLAVVAIGLWQSNIPAQDLWSATLAGQAQALLGVAAIATVGAVWAVPVRRLRGWPALAIVAVLGTIAALGAKAVLAASGIAACCVIVGYATLLLGGVRTRIDPILGVATGVGVVVLALVTAGLLWLDMRVVFWVIPAAALAAMLVPPLRRAIADSLAHGFSDAAPWNPARAICGWLILFAWLYYAANAALPERLWDALAMHLLIPGQIATFGRWHYDSAQFAMALFPLAADYLFAFTLAWGNEPAIKAINLLLMAATLVTLHRIVRTFAAAFWADLGVLLLLALPVALLVTTAVMVESLLCLFAIAGVQAVLSLQRDRPDLQRQSLLALCVLLAAAPAVKLHGAVVAVPLAVIGLLRVNWRLLSRGDIWATIWFAAIFGALGAAQYANSFLLTGNPVFPMMNDLFHSPLWPPVSFEDGRWQNHLSWDLLNRMTFHSSAFLESYDGSMGFTMLGLLLPAFVATLLRPRPAAVVALCVAVFYVCVVGWQIQYIRYFYPVMPVVLIACMHAMAIAGRGWRSWPVGAYGLALAVGGLLVLPSGIWTLKAADLAAATDADARQAMVAGQVPTRLATAAINSSGVVHPRVIYAGEPYGELLQGTPIYIAWYNRGLNLALTAADDAALISLLDAQHPDFVVAAPASVDPLERKVIRYAEQSGRRVATFGSVAMWRIGPP
jgi:hypothetical protein